jgi:predicted DNA-binding transcriptional regulator AlpA
LADAREELIQLEHEFSRLQTRIEVVRESVADSLVRLFGEERPAFTGLQEEAFIERIAGRVVAQLATAPKPQSQGDKRYVRDVEAAKYLGVSAATLRSWRSKRSPSGPPVTRMGKMVMYSVKGLEQYMEQRTAEGW